MSERSYAGIQFFDVDQRNVEDIVGILQNHGFYMPDKLTDPLTIQDGWTDEEVRLGELHAACGEIVDRFPDTVFKAFQEADYEFTGDLDINEPENGYFHSEIDNGGNVTVTYDQIIAASRRIPVGASQDDLLKELRQEMGVDSIDAISKWESGARQPKHPQYIISETPSLTDAAV